MANIQVIKAELDGDPLGRGYAGMTDEQAAADMNTVYRSVAAFVTVDQVRQYLITQIDGSGINQRSSIDMIREFAEAGTVRGGAPSGNAPEARRSSCRMIWYMLQREDTDAQFPVDNQAIRNQFIAIGPDTGTGPSVLTGAQLQAIDAMATRQISRAVELGQGTVFGQDIKDARAL